MAWKPDYITAAQLKNYMRITHDDDDTEVADAVTAASRAVDRHCQRQFGVVAAAEQRFYTAWIDYERGLWVVDVDDFQSVANLTVEIVDVLAGVTGYRKEPVNAAAEGAPWTSLTFDADATALPTGAPHEIAVTALWGWTAVPAPVKLATKLQASRFLVRRDSPYGVAGSPENGSEVRLLSRVDPDLRTGLVDYRRARKPA